MDGLVVADLDEDWMSFIDADCPRSPADDVDLTTLELLEWAQFLPADGRLVDLLISLGTTGLDAACQIRLAQQWARVEAAACGQKLTAVAGVDAAGPDPDEAVDFRDLEVATALRLGTTSARNVMAVAGVLADKGPRVLEAMRAGWFGYLHALQYFDAFVDTPAHLCARVEELTLDRAAELTPTELRRLLRRTVTRVGADDFGRRHKAAKKDAHLTADYDDKDGMGTLSGRLSAVDLNIVDRAVEAWARAAKANGDERSLRELRVAGLVDMAERYLTGDSAPRAHGRPITVNLAVDLPTFLGLTNHPVDVLGTGALIPAEALRDLIPQASLRRIITDPMTGHLLDYGRSTYRFPADVAGHVFARSVVSTGPGSTVPAERCDIDHPKAWDDGGRTCPGNGQAVNRRWHRAKTIGGWTVTQVDDGWIWASPLGLESKTTPHDYRLGP